MPGPRKASLHAGVYAAGSLGEVQPDNRAVNYFKKSKECRMGRHAWLFGTENAVCSRCGTTVDKRKVMP